MESRKSGLTCYLFLMLCLGILPDAFSQSYNLLWDKTYGGDSRDWNCNITMDASGSLFLTGDSRTDLSGDKTVALCDNQTNTDVWLMKLDAGGAIVWQRGLGGDRDELMPYLVHLNNPAKEMLLICYSASDSVCEKTEVNRDTIPIISADYWMCLLDSNGIVIWDKTFGGDNYDDNVQAAALTTGEFLVAGESNSPVGYDKSVPNYTISNDFWTLLVDGSGNKLWDQVYGGDGTESLGSVIADDDGSFLLAGTTNSTVSGDVSVAGQGLQDFWMIKIDATGNKIWDKRFGGTGPDICKYATRSNDNGYVLCGYTVSPQGGDVSQAPKGLQDYWVVKTDSAGNKVWDKRFGGTDGSFGTWIAQASNGGYWVGGYSDSDNFMDPTEVPYGGSDYWFFKMDENGTKLWDKRLGGSGNEVFGGLAFTADSTIYAFGYSDTGSSSVKTAIAKGWLDYWVVKFSYTDTTTSLPVEQSDNFTFEVMPNPSSGNFKLHVFSDQFSEFSFTISDLTGQNIYKNNFVVSPGKNTFPVNTEKFSKGIYMLKLHSGKNDFKVLKLVLQ